jgi:hypothetical protein
MLVGSLATGVSAQTGQDTMGHDSMGKTQTKGASYTGCVEAGEAVRTYVLTHVTTTDDHMGNDAMGKDSMSKSAMAPSMLSIVSQTIDLSAHVGHKVTVSGAAARTSDAMKKDTMSKDTMASDTHAFSVKTLTMVATSCR